MTEAMKKALTLQALSDGFNEEQVQEMIEMAETMEIFKEEES